MGARDGAMSEEVLPKIESIKIDPAERYILLVHGMSTESMDRLMDDVRVWWEGDEPVLALWAAPGIEFHLERVGE